MGRFQGTLLLWRGGPHPATRGPAESGQGRDRARPSLPAAAVTTICASGSGDGLRLLPPWPWLRGTSTLLASMACGLGRRGEPCRARLWLAPEGGPGQDAGSWTPMKHLAEGAFTVVPLPGGAGCLTAGPLGDSCGAPCCGSVQSSLAPALLPEGPRGDVQGGGHGL